MLKSCKYCGRIHDSRFDCGRKPKPKPNPNRKDYGYKKKYNDTNKFRNTKAWQRKRAYIKQRDLYLCRVCRDRGRYVQGVEVHHIVPISEDYDLRLTNSNLVTLCDRCHDQADSGQLSRAYLRGLTAND